MATLTTGGKLAEILNLTLSSTADIQVGFVNLCNTVIIKARTAVDIQVRTSPSAPNYFTIPAGSSLTFNMVGNTQGGSIQATNIWLRSTSSTPVAEVIGLYG